MEFAGQEGAEELDCWGAACVALASVAPRFGITPQEVRQLCLSGASEAQGDLEQAKFMAAFLVQAIVDNGADKRELIEIAQGAFRAHRKLQSSLTVSDLI